MINKIIFLLFLIILIINQTYSNIITINSESSSTSNKNCTSFIDINSKFNQSEPCGLTLEQACQNITFSLKTCNLIEFDEITFNFQPGTYNFNGIDPFGTTINEGKSINIVNQQYSLNYINSTSMVTSVIFNLDGILNSFINISNAIITNIGDNSINIQGITFINGNSNNKVLYGQGGQSGNQNILFENCIFENNTGGSILLERNQQQQQQSQQEDDEKFLKLNSNNILINIKNCIYQNTWIYQQVQGGFIFIDDELKVNLNIDQTQFINFYGSLEQGGLVYYDNSESYSNTNDIQFSLTNSLITQGESNSSYFYLTISNSLIQNNTFYQNTGGIGFTIYSITSDNSISSEVRFNQNNFTSNFNTTCIYIKDCSTDSSDSGNNGDITLTSIKIDDNLFQFNNFTKLNTNISRNGVITIDTSSVGIVDTIFRNNNSPLGASLIINNSQLGSNNINVIILNSLFQLNNATLGGGLYTNQGNLILQGNTTFDSNQGVTGSAIYCQSSTIDFQGDIQFENNIDTSIQSQFGIGCGSGLACTLEGNPQYQDTCSSYEPNKAKLLTPVEVTFIVIGTILGAFLICVVIIIIIRKVSLYNRYRPIGY